MEFIQKILRILISRRMISNFALGISSGLPLLLIGSTLKAWMKDAGLDLTTIGLFGLVGLPYTFKFLWSPIVDRWAFPFLDRRRSWMLISQILLAISFFYMTTIDAAQNLSMVAITALCIAFFSATQDIAIDSYRRELHEDNELGLASSLAVNGYRIGMLLAGAFALPLAEQLGWSFTYMVMAALMLSCTIFTFLAPKLEQDPNLIPQNLKEAVIDPFIEYFQRPNALIILSFVLLYKIGDQMASDMLTPFYLDIGFSKTQIGLVSKFFGFWAVISGGLLGGIIILRFGLMKSLWYFAWLQAFSTAGFSILNILGTNLEALAIVVAVENLASGMGTTAYTAYMASLCNRKFTATQYALLSSFIGIPRVFLGSTSGYIASNIGWTQYFIFCTIIALPGIIILRKFLKSDFHLTN